MVILVVTVYWRMMTLKKYYTGRGSAWYIVRE